MRIDLHKYNGLIGTFSAKVIAFSHHKITLEPTVLLVNVIGVDLPSVHIGHAWCIQNENFNEDNLKVDSHILFEATVVSYRKGSFNRHGKRHEWDYGFMNPIKIAETANQLATYSPWMNPLLIPGA